MITNGEVLIRVEGLRKSFGDFYALDGINEEIRKGEVVVIVGPSGSGKSTFLRSLNLLEVPTEGHIYFENVDITDKNVDLDKHRQKMGMVFQHFNLFPHKTILENITLAPIKLLKKSKEEAETRAMELLKLVNLEEKANSYPSQLSGGQKQRVAIAGIIAMRSECIILDEPTAMLDPQGRRELIKLIKDYREQTGSAVVVVSHSMEDIASLADKVIVMNNSRIEMQGTVDEVYSRGEELRRIGLNIPEITEIFLRLRARGFDVPANVYTVEQGAAILKALASGRRGK